MTTLVFVFYYHLFSSLSFIPFLLLYYHFTFSSSLHIINSPSSLLSLFLLFIDISPNLLLITSLPSFIFHIPILLLYYHLPIFYCFSFLLFSILHQFYSPFSFFSYTWLLPPPNSSSLFFLFYFFSFFLPFTFYWISLFP